MANSPVSERFTSLIDGDITFCDLFTPASD